MNDRAPESPSFDEVEEFVATLRAAPGSRLTACQGWTVHEIVAHLAAGSAEIADLIDDHVAGRPARPTRAFEDREPPFRLLAHDILVERMFQEAARAAAARRLLADLDDDSIEFTGRKMSAAEFATHARSERVLHRWDMIGRDDVGWAMLAQPDLAVHSVKILNEMAVLAETPTNRLASTPATEFEMVLRSDDHDDLIITDRCNRIVMTLVPQDDRRVTALLDPAARLLAMWGRRDPTARIEIDPSADRTMLFHLFGW